MKAHIFTVDVENWYDGLPNAGKLEARFESRLESNVRNLLSILQDKGVYATFFWLGSLAENSKALIREILELGHDIGCHGWSHTLLGVLGRQRFLAETRRALGTISDIIGEPVRYYRAPFFSISDRTSWALPILAQFGVEFDSSIVPVKYWRYGFPGFDPSISILHTDLGDITEVPVSTREFMGRTIPFGGGAWFRVLPYKFAEQGFQKLEDDGVTGVFYIHPWELDRHHPRILLHPRAGITHYCNLRNCEERMGLLLDRFAFTSMGQFFPVSCQSLREG